LQAIANELEEGAGADNPLLLLKGLPDKKSFGGLARNIIGAPFFHDVV